MHSVASIPVLGCYLYWKNAVFQYETRPHFTREKFPEKLESSPAEGLAQRKLDSRYTPPYTGHGSTNHTNPAEKMKKPLTLPLTLLTFLTLAPSVATAEHPGDRISGYSTRLAKHYDAKYSRAWRGQWGINTQSQTADHFDRNRLRVGEIGRLIWPKVFQVVDEEKALITFQSGYLIDKEDILVMIEDGFEHYMDGQKYQDGNQAFIVKKMTTYQTALGATKTVPLLAVYDGGIPFLRVWTINGVKLEAAYASFDRGDVTLLLPDRTTREYKIAEFSTNDARLIRKYADAWVRVSRTGR